MTRDAGPWTERKRLRRRMSIIAQIILAPILRFSLVSPRIYRGSKDILISAGGDMQTLLDFGGRCHLVLVVEQRNSVRTKAFVTMIKQAQKKA
jgi:hypothetical protein